MKDLFKFALDNSRGHRRDFDREEILHFIDKARALSAVKTSNARLNSQIADLRTEFLKDIEKMIELL